MVEAQVDPAARIGTTLKGKWRIERLLGSGGFASVYAATHRAGKRVAIKVLHAALGVSEEVRRRFMREAYAANAVEHPAVVGVSDDDVTEDGAPFLVMDLLEGETAEARRRNAGGKLAVSAVLQLAEEALDGLAAAHAKGIVHRDLKPENLFMTTAGNVKVLDFGIARFREPGDESSATQTGLTMGSPAFMAPEQARGRWSEVDARTDVYSMGATMFVLLSGRLVHGKRNLNEALIEAATRPAPPLSSAAPEVPGAVAAVVDRALAFEKEARWPDAAAMRDAVRRAKSAVSAMASASGAPTGTLPLGAIPAVGSHDQRDSRPSGADANTAYSMALPAGGLSEPSHPTAPLPSSAASSPPNTELAPPGALPGSHGTTSSPIITSSPVTTTQGPSKRPRMVPVVAASVVAVLGIGAFVAWSRTRPSPEGSAPAVVPPQETTSGGRADVVTPSANAGTVVSAAPVEPTASVTAAPSAAPPPKMSVAASTPAPPATAKAVATTAVPNVVSSAGATVKKPAPNPVATSTSMPTSGDDPKVTHKRK